MNKFRAGIILFVLVLLKGAAVANVQTLVVMPFSNLSKNPGFQWVGESFPELLQDRMVWPNLNPLGREERLIAFDRIGIAYSNQLSKASLIKIGQELDSNYLILGDFTCDGQRLQASASVLDMHRNYLGPGIQEEGTLLDLQLICGRIAWRIVNYLDPHVSVSQEVFLKRFPVIPLEALENYIRGLMESDTTKQIRYFREADKDYPNYPEPIFQLGKIYYEQKDYSTSCLWLQRLTRMNRNIPAASFFLGLDYLNLGNYEKAMAEFQQLSQVLPLNAVYTNLGIALSYQGLNDKATKAFQLALEGDPSGVDFYFNLAYHLWKLGDFSKAAQNLKALTQKTDQDGQAYYLLYKCQQTLGRVAEAEAAWALARQLKPEVETWENRKRIPDLFRIQNRFDETTFRLLQMEIEQLQNNKTSSLPDRQEVHGSPNRNP
jgi:tetratricopeptide (TPR) repeat protein